MTRTSVDEPIHRPGSSRLLFSQLRPAIPPSSRNSSGGVYDARAKDKGDTRGIDKVGSIHGSAAVMSTTSQRRTIHLRAACLEVFCGGTRTGSLSTSALSIGSTLTRRPIEIRAKMGDCVSSQQHNTCTT